MTRSVCSFYLLAISIIVFPFRWYYFSFFNLFTNRESKNAICGRFRAILGSIWANHESKKRINLRIMLYLFSPSTNCIENFSFYLTRDMDKKSLEEKKWDILESHCVGSLECQLKLEKLKEIDREMHSVNLEIRKRYGTHYAPLHLIISVHA